MIDRAAQEGPVFPSVSVTIRPLNRDPEKPPPADQNYHFDDAFAFDGPSFQSFKRDLDRVVVPPRESYEDVESEPGEETLEDDTVRSVEMFWKGQNPDEGILRNRRVWLFVMDLIQSVGATRDMKGANRYGVPHSLYECR